MFWRMMPLFARAWFWQFLLEFKVFFLVLLSFSVDILPVDLCLHSSSFKLNNTAQRSKIAGVCIGAGHEWEGIELYCLK